MTETRAPWPEKARQQELKAGNEFIKYLLRVAGYRWNAHSKSWACREGKKDRGIVPTQEPFAGPQVSCKEIGGQRV